MKEHLIKLILAGDEMTDAAETCGHDEALDDWNRTVSSIRKKHKITDADISSFRAKQQSAENSRSNAKNIKLLKQLEEKKKKDAELLKEFGIIQ